MNIPVTISRAVPVITYATAEVKTGASLTTAEESMIYQAQGVKAEKLQGTFTLKENDRKLTAFDSGEYAR